MSYPCPTSTAVLLSRRWGLGVYVSLYSTESYKSIIYPRPIFKRVTSWNSAIYLIIIFHFKEINRAWLYGKRGYECLLFEFERNCHIISRVKYRIIFMIAIDIYICAVFDRWLYQECMLYGLFTPNLICSAKSLTIHVVHAYYAAIWIPIVTSL